MADEQVRKITLITNNHEKIEQNYSKVELVEFYLKDHKELAKLLDISEFSALKIQWAAYDHVFFCDHRKEIMKEFGGAIQKKLLAEDKK